MNDKELIARHPELVALRQFKTGEEIMKALRQGVIFYRMETSHGEPIEYIQGPLTVAGEWREGECGTCVAIRHIGEGYCSKMYLDDLQNSLAKALFTTKERARAYYRACRARYEGDKEWRAFVAKERAESDEWM